MPQDDGLPDVQYPAPVCPDREAGKVHLRHRIAGTWRQDCPGVTAPAAPARDTGRTPVRILPVQFRDGDGQPCEIETAAYTAAVMTADGETYLALVRPNRTDRSGWVYDLSDFGHGRVDAILDGEWPTVQQALSAVAAADRYRQLQQVTA